MILSEQLMDQAELLELAHDAIILTDAHGDITYWNRGACRTYGWEKKDALGQNVDVLLRTEFSDDLTDQIDTSLKQKAHWEGELIHLHQDGRKIRVTSRWTIAHGNPASPRLQINTVSTLEQQSEVTSRERTEPPNQPVTDDFTGNLSIRPDGQIADCNQAIANIFGFASIEETLTGNFFELLRHRKDGVELLERVRQDGIVERHELEMKQKGGEPVYVVARLVGSFTDGRLIDLQTSLFNDTKRKRLEQQLIQAQKMEGLGTLAGGIAHDFNNILAIILGYTNRVGVLSAKSKEATDSVRIIKEAVDRGAALVQQLLTSARQTEARFSALDLNELVRELQKMLEATFPKTINFELHLDPSLPLITADRSQVHQVLLNLCVNARDAMKDGGVLTLETSKTTGSKLSASFTATAEDYACIRVRDTGSGMTSQIKAHIFEPFFTTKERSKGTGLGLSVVYGVVNNHRGFMQVESEPNKGTTFIVYLPVEHVTEKEDKIEETQVTQKQQAPQKILLVEDEEMLRDLGVTVLESEGYQVITAKDGMEAVSVFETNRNDIGLVICDLGLPRLGGREAFLKMKESNPNVRAIVASGYLEPMIRSEMLKAGVLDTIQKPYDFNDLLTKIRSVIGPEAGASNGNS
jgi:PAS domain S-box-containing protein